MTAHSDHTHAPPDIMGMHHAGRNPWVLQQVTHGSVGVWLGALLGAAFTVGLRLISLANIHLTHTCMHIAPCASTDLHAQRRIG